MAKSLKTFAQYEIGWVRDHHTPRRRCHRLLDLFQLSKKRLRLRVVVNVKRFQSLAIQLFLVALHRGSMKPQFLFVKFGGIACVAEKQAVFDDDNAARPFLQPRMAAEQLMRKYEQIHGTGCWLEVD